VIALWLTAGLLSGQANAAAATTAGRPASWSYIRRKVRKADDAGKLVEAINLAAPNVGAWQPEYEALRLKAQRLAREEAALERWQADMARAAIIAELRLLMLSIEAAANDDEEAAELLLLAA
jgi:sugar phosphate isomerase/epimerase